MGVPVSEKQLTPREAAQRVLDAARQKMESEMARLMKAEEVGKSLFGLPTVTPSQRAMADGQQVHQQVPSKSVFRLLAQRVQKAETFINLEHPSEPGSDGGKKGRQASGRYTEQGKPAGNLPGDRVEKRVREGLEVSADNPPKSKTGEKTGGATMEKAGEDPGKQPTMQTMTVPKPQTGAALKPAGVPGEKAGQAPSVPKPPAAPGMKGQTMKTEKGVFARLSKKKVK